MKTAKEWAEYLPLDIKLWFIEECESEGSKLNNLYDSLLECVWQEFDWANTELGYDFWSGVKELCLKYKDREADILKDLEWIDDLLEWIDELGFDKNEKTLPKWGELIVVPTLEQAEPLKKSSIYGKVIKGLKIENKALTQSNLKLIEELNSVHKENAEFKKRHKTLLKANQESMERRVELGDANMKLLSENEELKARCEALTLEVSQLEKDLGVANATVYLQKETRDDLMKQIKGLKEIIADLKTEKENSIWSKIKNLCN